MVVLLLAGRGREFFCGEAWPWNLFDLPPGYDYSGYCTMLEAANTFDPQRNGRNVEMKKSDAGVSHWYCGAAVPTTCQASKIRGNKARILY